MKLEICCWEYDNKYGYVYLFQSLYIYIISLSTHSIEQSSIH